VKKQKTTPADPPEVWQKSPVPNLIRYVPSGVYFARVRVGGKLIRRSLGCTKFSVAQLRLADFIKDKRTQLESRQTAEAGQLTFTQAEDIYRERLELSTRLKPASKEYRHKTLDYLHSTWPGLAELDLAKISAQECTAWATRFKKAQYSPTVFNNTLGTLKAVLAISLEAGVRYGNPAAGISRMPVRVKQLKLPNRNQFLQLVKQIANRGGRFSRDCSHLVQFLAYGGFRKSEAAAIRWEDCDFKTKEITVRGDPVHGTKNWSTRRVPMIPAMLALLQEIKTQLGSINDPDKVMRIHECQKALERACEDLKIPRLTHHDLRHLFATTCIEAGVDIPTVSRWLGHKDGGALAMKVYGHLRDHHSTDMAQKVVF
jgi:integrase